MSTLWSTKTSGIRKDFVVLKHTLRDIDGIVCGARFRSGYTVVEKGSRVYRTLKSLPLIKKNPEYQLDALEKLPFIVMTKDIQTIFGAEVYFQYQEYMKFKKLKSNNIISEVEEFLPQVCSHVEKDGATCLNRASIASQKGLCRLHTFENRAEVKRLTGFSQVGLISKAKKEQLKVLFDTKIIEEEKRIYSEMQEKYKNQGNLNGSGTDTQQDG